LWGAMAASEARIMSVVGVIKAFKAPLPADEDPLQPLDARARLGNMSAGAESSLFDGPIGETAGERGMPGTGAPTEEMPVNDPRQDRPRRKVGVRPHGELSHDEAMAMDEEDRQRQIALGKIRALKNKMRAERAEKDRVLGQRQKRRGKKPVYRPIGGAFGNVGVLTPKGMLSSGQQRVIDNMKRKLVGVGPKSSPGKTWWSDMVDHSPSKPEDPAQKFDQQFDEMRDLASRDTPMKRGRAAGRSQWQKRINDMKAFRKKWFLHEDNEEGPDGSPLPAGWHPDTPWERSKDWYRPIAGGKQNEGRPRVGVRGPQTKQELQPEPEPEPEGRTTTGEKWESQSPAWKDHFIGSGNDLGSLRGAEDPHPYPEILGLSPRVSLGRSTPAHRTLMNIQNKKEEMRGRRYGKEFPPIHDMSPFDAHDARWDEIKLEHAKKRANTTDPKVLGSMREKEQKALRNHQKKFPGPPESLTSQKLWQDILDWHGRAEAARREAGYPDMKGGKFDWSTIPETHPDYEAPKGVITKKSYQVGVRRRLVGVM